MSAMHKNDRRFILAAAAVVLAALAAGASPARAETAARKVPFDIPSQPMATALLRFSEQTGIQVTAEAGTLKVLKSAEVHWDYPATEALSLLLKGSGLTYKFVDRETIVVRQPGGEAASSGARDVRAGPVRLVRADPAMQKVDTRYQDGGGASKTDNTDEMPDADGAPDRKGIPEMLVKGARSQNSDIRRTEDDVQPYVVFDAAEIERSMAPDLDTFLKTRLPMNQTRGSPGQDVTGYRGNLSSIDLRGLGAEQTLILVNGRRMPGVSNATDLNQPDINGIPLSAVERIEILPSTAGGIYGGGATGGVVNVILKRDYNDLELTARYDGTFAGGGAQRRIDGTAGFTLEGGRTHVLVTGSYRDGNPLYVGDRDFLARSRALQDENNHGFYTVTTTPLHGYTTNIASANGANLVLKDGMRPLNSRIAYVPAGYAGPDSDNGEAFLETADHYNLEPANDVLGNQYGLMLTPEVRSLQLSVRREFSDRIEAYVDAARYDNKSVRMGSPDALSLATFNLPAGPNNPFVQAVRLSIPVVGFSSDQLHTDSASLSEQLNGGVIVRLSREWTLQGEYTLGRSKYTSEQPYQLLTADGIAALTDGRLDPLADVNGYRLDFSAFDPGEAGNRRSYDFPVEQKGATLRISGPLLALPGGSLRLASLLERREQYTGDQVIATYPTGGTPRFTYYPDAGSSTDSAYVELNAPLFSSRNGRPGLLGLDMLASYRYDATKTRTRPSGLGLSYADVPSFDGPFPDLPYQTQKVTGNQYTLGLRYTPVEDLALRVSYGEGILPPQPSQLSESDSSLPSFVSFVFSGRVDPKRGSLPVDTSTIERYTSLGSLILRPERSASWSGGLIFTPSIVPGLRLSVDYTRIEKTDEIGSLDTQVRLDLEDSFPGMIVRNQLTPADAELGYTAGTIREFNGGRVNIARSFMEAFDFQVDYRWDTRFGSFAASLLATVEPHLSQQAAPGGDEVDRVGYSNGPLKWRGNTGLRWSRGALELGWNMQYYDASLIYTRTASLTTRNNQILNQGSAWLPTQSYHDIYGRYRFADASGFAGGLLQNSELQVSVQNALNSSPPILTSSSYLAIGSYATEGDPRLRRYSISFTKRFGK